MFHSIFLKTLRDQRWSILIWGLTFFVILIAGYSSFQSLLSDANGKQSLTDLAQQFKYFGEPVAIGTVDGFVTFRYDAFFATTLGIWAVIVGARLVRGEEVRGSIELILATPQSRARVLLEKIGAFAVVVAAIGLIVALGAIAGRAIINEALNPAGAFLEGGNLALFAFVFGMIGLLLAQFTATPGGASGVAGGLLMLSFVLDASGRLNPDARTAQWLSPNFYFGLSKPLIPSYGANPGAMLVLLGLGAIAAAGAYVLFLRRDLSGIALNFSGDQARKQIPINQQFARTLRDVSLRSVLVRQFGSHGRSLLWWMLGVYLYAAFATSLVKSAKSQIESLVQSSSLTQQVLNNIDVRLTNGFLAVILFYFASLVVMVYTLLRANAWVTDQDNGRLDIVLSTPQPRWRVALESYGAMVLAFVGVALANWLGALSGASKTGITIDGGRVFIASLALVPAMLLLAGMIFALGARLRSGPVMGIVGGYIGLSFLMNYLRAVITIPDGIANLSIFSLYGTPIVNGIDWLRTSMVLLVAAGFVAIGIIFFQREDTRQGG